MSSHATDATDQLPPDVDGAGDASEARREAILSAALDVFADRGFTRSTIKAIASAADLRSPALLYWYFPNKLELFASVLRRYVPALTDTTGAEELVDLPPEVFLRGLMQQALQRFADPQIRKAFWLLIVEHSLLAEHGVAVSDERPRNVYTLLRDYFLHQVELGVLRPHDADMAARIVIGQLNLALQAQTASVGLLPPVPDGEVLIDGTLDLLLRGLQPR